MTTRVKIIAVLSVLAVVGIVVGVTFAVNGGSSGGGYPATYAGGVQAARAAKASDVNANGSSATYCAGIDPTPGAASADVNQFQGYTATGIEIHRWTGTPFWQGCANELGNRGL